jgi:hypothetical protein
MNSQQPTGLREAGHSCATRASRRLPLPAEWANRYDSPPLDAISAALGEFVDMSNYLLWLLIAVAPADSPDTPPDTLVVCPTPLRAALAPWEAHRREQGHRLAIIEPGANAAELQAEIRRIATSGELKYVVLIGDVPVVPTYYTIAQVNVRWGSEPAIATDHPYADFDSDGLPDVAVGRIPADTPAELAAFARKVIRYEKYEGNDSWRRRLNVVAGVGGFGAFTDALIEAAARSVFEQVVPKHCDVRRLDADPAKSCAELSAGSFAWIYLGHGLPSMLDAVDTPTGPRPILAVRDVPQIACGPNCPLAVLVACYTGAIDAQHDCLGEELTLAERGPIATIAATRVTMPYGNSVFGCELLRAAFANESSTLGDIWLRAQQQTIAPTQANDALRNSLDALARGVSPPPVELDAERREHVLLYQLLGDPLLRVTLPAGPARVADSTGGKSVK